MKTSKQAFTMSELLVSIMVASILILMVGAIASVAAKEYSDLRHRWDSNSDAQFALDFMRRYIRPAKTVAPALGSSPSTSCLLLNDKYFYVLGDGTKLVFGSTCNGLIYSPIVSKLSGLVLSWSVTSKLVAVTLNGSKSGVPFNYSMQAGRRN